MEITFVHGASVFCDLSKCNLHSLAYIKIQKINLVHWRTRWSCVSSCIVLHLNKKVILCICIGYHWLYTDFSLVYFSPHNVEFTSSTLLVSCYLRKIVSTMKEIKLMFFSKSPTKIDLPSTFVEQLLFTSAFRMGDKKHR